jgi:PAS domain S-box-containing protein
MKEPDQLRQIIDTIPALAWSAASDGSVEFVNQRWLDYTGFSAEQTLDYRWLDAIHPQDLPRMLEIHQEGVDSGHSFEMEGRLRRYDGEFRYFLFRASPLCDRSGRVVKWYGTSTDIEDFKRAEEARRSNEQSLRLIVDSIPGLVCTLSATGEVKLLNRQILEYFGKTAEELKGWATSDAVHPDDLPRVIAALTSAVDTGQPYDIEHRCRRADGVYRWFQVRALPMRDAEGSILCWYILLTDIDERKRAEEKLRRSEAFLHHAQRLSLTGSFGWNVSSGEIFWSNETFRIFGYDQTVRPSVDVILRRVHPDDRALVQQAIDRASAGATDFDFEHRLLMPDGTVKYLQVVAHALTNSSHGLEFAGAVMDITERKRAEETLRQTESYLAEAQRLTHASSWVWQVAGGDALHLSDEWYRIYGFDPGQGLPAWEKRLQRIHPTDRAKWKGAIEQAIRERSDYEMEFRALLPDGTIKHLHTIGHPILNESGHPVKFVGTTMDVTEQWHARSELEKAFEENKRLKDRLQDENLALREHIDQALMFEEIVGASPALRAVLSRVSKVGPTDSTVLLTGETGTGKELIARAIHKRSRRCSRAFVSVNCAAIPASLITSELFGHEKGAFTGAVQRRAGRFELAEEGTIFLDEVGELPAETQITLLHVLQEREFERVGGNQTIRADVRVIAATNRDLEAAIAAGSFRSDLFYRLNVFPIQIPPLRERSEDIPLLVEYFIDRFARKAGKGIRGINKKTLDLLLSYPWPGNIRELQNVVERSVIVCETENFSVDESWLSREPLASDPKRQLELSPQLAAQERLLIETALRESGGRVSGSLGAAARLGIHRSTLESKIASHQIDKYRFKAANPSKNS